jgi:hypothetical protein
MPQLGRVSDPTGMHPTRFSLALLLLVLTACGGEDRGNEPFTSGVSVRDSAGIRIVENHDSALTEATRWRVAAEPDLRIGSLDGSVPGTDWGEFVQVRAVGDRTVVLDPQSMTVRLFDVEGDFVRSYEFQGDGPMELRTFGQNAAPTDSSMVFWGLLNRRIVTLDLETGDRTATSTPARGWDDAGTLMLNGWLDDGSFLMVGMPDLQEMETGRRVLEGRLFRFAADGTFEEELTTLPMMEAWRTGEMSLGPVTSAPNGVTVIRGNEVWHAFPDDGFELSRLDPATGRPAEIVRLGIPRDPVTDQMRERTLEQQRALMENLFGSIASVPPEARRMLDAMLDGMQFADSLPPFAGYGVGLDGTLWIPRLDPAQMLGNMELIDFENPPEFPDVSVLHVVVDPDGRWLGTIETPLGFQPQEFGRDYVLGTRSDEFDVPYVERYRILKPE